MLRTFHQVWTFSREIVSLSRSTHNFVTYQLLESQVPAFLHISLSRIAGPKQGEEETRQDASSMLWVEGRKIYQKLCFKAKWNKSNFFVLFLFSFFILFSPSFFQASRRCSCRVNYKFTYSPDITFFLGFSFCVFSTRPDSFPFFQYLGFRF